MRFPIRFFPDESNIPFMRMRYIGFAVSLLVILVAAFLVVDRGLNLGIDFTGGALIEIRTPEKADLAPMRGWFSQAGRFGEVSLQLFGDEQEVLIRIQTGEEEQAKVVEEAKQLLIKNLPSVEFRRIEYVGPTVGQELVRSGVLALGLAMVCMMLYIWFRFEWQFGVGGILALMHDAIALIGFYALTQTDFGLPAIAAVLTVIGYSINDSVVIYDRVRENLRKYKRRPLVEILDQSVNETLSRTVLTGGTTLLAILALILWGGEVVRGFSVAIFFGIAVGTYSSIFVSAPVLIYLGVRDLPDPSASDPHPQPES